MVKSSRSGDHDIAVVPVRQPSAKKDPANVDVVGDVTALEVAHRNPEITL